MAQRAVRWGILGLANITRRFVPALHEAAQAELVAVATRRVTAAASLLAAHPNLRVHADYDALLSDPEVDAVYLPLPNTLHAPWTIRALAAGKHVLCEKPLAMTVADAEAITSAARRAGRLVMEGFMWRFHPQHTRVRALLTAGVLGDVTLVRASLSFTIDRSRQNIRLDPALGGGVLWDVGCYALSIPRFVFDAEPESVTAAARIDPVLGVDVSLAALATFAGGRMAVLDASMERVRRATYEVVGTDGSLAVESFWAEPDAPARLVLTDARGVRSYEIVSPNNHFVGEIEHFGAAVRGEAVLRYGPADALAQMRALAAVQRAVVSRQVETVTSAPS